MVCRLEVVVHGRVCKAAPSRALYIYTREGVNIAIFPADPGGKLPRQRSGVAYTVAMLEELQ